jgi:hypothetical protein
VPVSSPGDTIGIRISVQPIVFVIAVGHRIRAVYVIRDFLDPPVIVIRCSISDTCHILIVK